MHNIPELSKSGYLLLKDKRYKEAEEEFRKILEIDKKNLYALVGIGDIYKEQKLFEVAVEYFKKAIDIDPFNKFALIGLADCYRGLKRFKDAIGIWEEYLSKNGNEFDIAIVTRLADTYRRTGSWENAIRQYEKALQIDPLNPYALSGLGFLHFEKGNYEESLSYWNRLLLVEKDDIKVLTNIGNCNRKLNQYNEALKYFYRALHQQENNFYALYGIADCYRGLKEHSKAIEYWRKILKIDPENRKILTRLGDAYRNLGNLKTARFYYREAIEREFDYYAVLGLSKINKTEKNYEAAIENLNQLRNLSGLNFQLTLLLSECYMEMNNIEMGIKVLSDALKKGINNEEIKKRLSLLEHRR